MPPLVSLVLGFRQDDVFDLVEFFYLVGHEVVQLLAGLIDVVVDNHQIKVARD